MSDTILKRHIFDVNPLVEGCAKGTALVLTDLDNYTLITTDEIQVELDRFQRAKGNLLNEFNQMTKKKLSDEQKSLLETSILMLKDVGWNKKIIEQIQKSYTAESAIHIVTDLMIERMSHIADIYIQERQADIKDLSKRLLHILEFGKNNKKKNKNIILVAQTLGPAELLDYDLSTICGIVLVKGSPTMHVTIVARAYNIPVVSGISDAMSDIYTGDVLVVDADHGRLYQNPSDDVLDELNHRQRQIKKQRDILLKSKNLPSVTKDNVYIELGINLGLADHIVLDNMPKYDKVGLYRTELPFMLAKELPSCMEQVKIYQKVLAHARGKTVVFRTLDIGSDKILPYFHHAKEENPAMGWRSTRMTLDRRSLLRTQLRAMIRATKGKSLSVMFPMIADSHEFLMGRTTLDFELKQAERRGEELPSEIHVGTMLEIPSLIFDLKPNIHLFDFVSIGTNDLMQFMFAADRGNTNVSSRYDALSVSFLRALKYIQAICQEARVPCSVCGEMAGRPLDALALIGLGFRSLSMNPGSLLRVKSALRMIDTVELSEFVLRLIQTEPLSIRGPLQSYLRDKNILL